MSWPDFKKKKKEKKENPNRGMIIRCNSSK